MWTEILLENKDAVVGPLRECAGALEQLAYLIEEYGVDGFKLDAGDAGHYNDAEDLIVDTHGADVIPDVWEILRQAFDTFGVFPVLRERDFNLPPLPELFSEVEQIASLQRSYAGTEQVQA